MDCTFNSKISTDFMEEHMKKAIITSMFCLGVSFFFGYVVIAVGIGSVYPSKVSALPPCVPG